MSNSQRQFSHCNTSLHCFFTVEPQCLVDYIQTSYHQLGDIVQLKCQVLANPTDLQFTWQLNGTTLAANSDATGLVDANRSTVVSHTVPMPIGDPFEARENAGGDKLRGKANLPQPSRTATHSSSIQQHLITNVVRIELRKWTSFGHYSCQARNGIGQQKEACKWHIAPYHYHPGRIDEHLGGLKHHHRNHHRHHQQQSLLQHHLHFASIAGALNNCQIIESSNAVVIKCLEPHDPPFHIQDSFAQVGNDAAEQPPNPSTIDRVALDANGNYNDQEQGRGKAFYMLVLQICSNLFIEFCGNL